MGLEINMTRVDAIYQDGVFRPLGPVALCENQRVALSVEPIPKEDALAWIKRVGDFRREMAAKRGIFPDSAVEIAEDRRR
jgi:predicted DNA-binding antitoxin AbrB/MazE fold protein